MKDHWTGLHAVGVLLIVAGVCLVVLLVPSDARLVSWLLTLGLLAVLAAVAGHGVTGRLRGALIDERNMMSLSRLQIALWTLVVASGYLAAVLGNVGVPDAPATVVIPPNLWLLMGISATSMVGSPLAKSNRRQAHVSQKAVENMREMLEARGRGQVKTVGAIAANPSPKNAEWGDLFRGEEVGNAWLFDMAKLQMFYFTVILVLIYGVQLGELLQNGTQGVATLPEVPGAMLAVLGVSHAGYLTSKAVPHTPPSAPPRRGKGE